MSDCTIHPDSDFDTELEGARGTIVERKEYLVRVRVDSGAPGWQDEIISLAFGEFTEDPHTDC
jgi:hypothetical protein